MSWVVIYTKPLQESRAKENLERLGVNVYLPLRPVEKVISGSIVVSSEPLFSRYIFVRNDGIFFHKIMHTLRNIRGVSHVVKFGGRFAELNEETVSSMLATEEGLLSRPVKAYKKGEKVKFTFGAFTNIEAVFKEPDGVARVILLMDLLSKPTKISVPIGTVKKAS